MALNAFQRSAFRLFGSRAEGSPRIAGLEEDLHRARMTVRAEAYLATAWTICILVAILAGFVALAAFLFALQAGAPGLWGIAFGGIPLLAVSAAYVGLLRRPAGKARRRGKEIDAKLPYAANYITAMASAGIIPTEIFHSLARQHVYGEVSREAASIYKDMGVHGRDVITALRRGIERSPSDRFQDLLQGAIATITSGGDLAAYFLEKSRRLQAENKQEQAAYIETMGLMSEAYVTAAVALPLFLIVMVAIFVLMGAIDYFVLQLIIYLLLPIASLGFMLGLKAMTPEV